MTGIVGKWIEATVTLIVLYLIVRYAFGFSTVVSSLTTGYANVIRAFQGQPA